MLSTFKVNYSQREPSTIEFQAKNEEYEFRLDEVNDVFGSPDRECYLAAAEFEAKDFWPLIVGPEHRNYQLAYSKATMVCNPFFRIILRLLAYTVFSRGQNPSV